MEENKELETLSEEQEAQEVQEVEENEVAPKKETRRTILYFVAGFYMLFLAYRIIFNSGVPENQKLMMTIVGIVFALSGGAMIGGAFYFYKKK